MRIKIEDYYGNDILELQVENIKDYHIIETDNYNVADVDEDERGEYVRVQYNMEANPDYWFVRQKNSEIDKLTKEIKKHKVQQVNKEIVIECLKSMLKWSDRLGSEEKDEMDFMLDMLTKKI